ncbi:MAG: DNA alkylation repair protein [Candidatus Muiribacteriota bacterium]
MLLNEILNELKQNIHYDSEKMEKVKSFLQISESGYGKGDIFLGVRVPVQRKIAKKYYKDCDLKTLQKLIQNKIHECRLTGLFILIKLFDKADSVNKKKYYKFYVQNLKWVNNWDLVDASAYKIAGKYIYEFNRNRDILYKWIRNDNIWIRRVGVVSTFYFIKNKDLDDIFRIAPKLLKDSHHLIHKAVGWMLREAGKRDEKRLKNFLEKYKDKMPRVMLRYSIEKFLKQERDYYLGRANNFK